MSSIFHLAWESLFTTTVNFQGKIFHLCRYDSQDFLSLLCCIVLQRLHQHFRPELSDFSVTVNSFILVVIEMNQLLWSCHFLNFKILCSFPAAFTTTSRLVLEIKLLTPYRNLKAIIYWRKCKNSAVHLNIHTDLMCVHNLHKVLEIIYLASFNHFFYPEKNTNLIHPPATSSPWKRK